jgi:hypothetical protein
VPEPQDENFTPGRRLAVRIAGTLGLVLFVFFFSMVAASALGLVQPGSEGSPNDPPPSPEAVLGASHPGEAVHVVGAVAVLAVGVSGLVGLIARPQRSGYAYQVLAAMTAVLLTSPLVGDPDNIGGQAGWVDPILLILGLPAITAGLIATPWRHRHSDESWKPYALLLAAIGAVPAGWYGVNQALIQRNTFPPTADPHHNAHWWTMAISVFLVVLVMAASGLPSARWQLGAGLASLAAVTLGASSLFAPSSASAIGPGWAVASIVWGLVGMWVTLRGTAEVRLLQDGRSP